DRKVYMESEIQGMIPEEIREIHPKQGYARIPAPLKIALLQLDPEKRAALGSNPETVKIQAGGKCYVQRNFNKADQPSLLGAPTYRWCEVLPVNAGSPDQVKDYSKFRRKQEIDGHMARGHNRDWAESHAKYKVPYNRKEKKDTTDKKELLALGKRTGDQVFATTVQYREFGKLKGTYVDGWKPDSAGRVHPFFLFAPATGQLSSENPNGQNIPSEKSRGASVSSSLIELAARFREIIEAPPDHV